MRRNNSLLALSFAMLLDTVATAEPIPVRHIQRPMHRFMVARSEAGSIIANGEFTQAVLGDEVSMRLTYKFVDGSIDDEMTTYSQRGTFRLVSNHHIQKGPFFDKPVDFAVEAAGGVTTSRTADSRGNVHVESHHVDLPDDLANGFIGTLLLNVPPNTAPFRVGLLAPVSGGRLVRLLISPEGEQPLKVSGQSLRVTLFRIHPELGGIVGVIASLLGLQPKDVMVSVLEGEDPAIMRIVGQFGGYGPVVTSDLDGISSAKRD